MAEQPTPGVRATDLPVVAFEELLRSVPRLVERTLAQAELARTLASRLPCMGSMLGNRRVPDSPGTVAPEQLGVLDLFDEPTDPTDPAGTTTTGTTTVADEAAHVSNGSTPTPVEADLAVPDYDSLAASQVVPRLAMLSPDDLRDVLAYEQSHRHRQTILNRVAQLLEA
jgi:hypothetical protein